MFLNPDCFRLKTCFDIIVEHILTISGFSAAVCLGHREEREEEHGEETDRNQERAKGKIKDLFLTK